MPDRNPTSHDVAQAAGVSQSAVSRAFTPGASISPAMRARIEEAASALGYRPNRLPGMMLAGRTGFVAVVVGGFYNPFHTLALEAFLRAIEDAGRQALVVQVESDRALDAIAGRLSGYRVDGIVSALAMMSEATAAALAAYRVPVVALNSGVTNAWVRSVGSDNAAGGAAAAKLLLARGARRFAWIGGPADSLAQGERRRGFLRALAEVGAPPPDELEGDYGYGSGYAAGDALARLPTRPDAVLCANDLTALGLIDALRIEHGLDCPRDVRVIGYDNIDEAARPGYRLTTFDQRLDRLAPRAIARLAEPADGPSPPERLAPELIERHSTAAR